MRRAVATATRCFPVLDSFSRSITAQAIRAVLFASATATTSGRRRRNPITHGSALVAFDRSRLALAKVHYFDRRAGQDGVSRSHSTSEGALRSACDLMRQNCRVDYITGPSNERINASDIERWCKSHPNSVSPKADSGAALRVGSSAVAGLGQKLLNRMELSDRSPGCVPIPPGRPRNDST
jgi:hypothetical protein